MKPSNEVKRKFIESIKSKGFKVKTDTGWSDIKYCHKTVDYDVWELRTTRHSLKCADTHIVFHSNYNNDVLDEVFVKDLSIGDFIHTKDGYDIVTSVTHLDSKSHMYDLELNDKNHRFYTSDILSHNSATTRAYILWYALFNADKVVAVLGNKLNLAQEQLQQLRDSYMMLPMWMQPGVLQWNKRGIQFTNKTRVICAATSPDGIRGLSINLLFLDEFAFIKPHIADEFMASVFPTISSGKTTKVIITSCVTKDTYVFTDKGIEQISDYINESHANGGYEVPEYSVLGMRDSLNTGTLMHNEGKVSTRIINTLYSNLECSLEHKLWACKDGIYDWYKSKDLNEGDFISVKYGMNKWGHDNIDFINTSHGRTNSNLFSDCNKLTPDICYLLGLYISEGNATDKPTARYMDITCGDDVSNAFTNLGLRYTLAKDKLHYRLSSASWVSFLLYLGFDITNKATTKIIPKRLMQMSKECTSALIQGIFDGDGYAIKDRYRVGIGLSSIELIKQIRILLLNYGILSTYNYSLTPPTKMVKVSSHCHTLEVTQYKSVYNYFNDIGFRFSRKQEVFDLFNEPTKIGNSADIVPYSKSLLQALKKEYKIPHDVVSFVGEKKDKKHFSRQKLLDIKDNLSNSINIDDTFLANVMDDVIWCKITSITENENHVYDFSLNEVENDKWCHSVIYNGIIGHQTPSGMNHFFNMWTNSVEPENANGVDYVKSEIPWNAVPGRDEQWARDEQNRIGEIRFNQEYKCDFIGSVSTLIDHHFLKLLETKEPMKIPKLPPFIKIWELPRKSEEMEAKNWEYVASLDSGYGVYKDNTVMQIFLVKSNITAHQVCTMHSNSMEIEEFCKKARVLLKKYNDPALIIEQNGPGIAATKYFHSTAEYDNLMHFDHTGNHMGLWASEKLKQNAVILLKTYVQRKFLKLHDGITINELHSYGQVTQNKWGALGGNHDDHVTSLYWIPFYLQSPLFYGNIVEVNIKQLEEDEIILTPEDEMASRDKLLQEMSDTAQQQKDLSNAAEYLSKNEENDEEDEDSPEESTLFFRR